MKKLLALLCGIFIVLKGINVLEFDNISLILLLLVFGLLLIPENFSEIFYKFISNIKEIKKGDTVISFTQEEISSIIEKQKKDTLRLPEEIEKVFEWMLFLSFNTGFSYLESLIRFRLKKLDKESDIRNLNYEDSVKRLRNNQIITEDLENKIFKIRDLVHKTLIEDPDIMEHKIIEESIKDCKIIIKELNEKISESVS